MINGLVFEIVLEEASNCRASGCRIVICVFNGVLEKAVCVGRYLRPAGAAVDDVLDEADWIGTGRGILEIGILGTELLRQVLLVAGETSRAIRPNVVCVDRECDRLTEVEM